MDNTTNPAVYRWHPDPGAPLGDSPTSVGVDHEGRVWRQVEARHPWHYEITKERYVKRALRLMDGEPVAGLDDLACPEGCGAGGAA